MSLLRQSSVSEDTILRSHGASTKRHGCCHNADGFTVIFCCFAILTAAITVALVIQIQLGHPEVTPYGAVATNAQECSISGVTVMRDGGNAVDSAIAALLCMSVVHPHIVGPGGGGVMLIHNHKANVSSVLDFMAAIPSKHNSPNHLDDIGTADVKSIGIPGFLHGLKFAHDKHGKLPWKKLFTHAIDLARNGFNVSLSLAEASTSLASTVNLGDNHHANYFEETFFPQRVALRVGDLMRRQKYAELLEKASERGAAVLWPLDYYSEVLNTLTQSGSLIIEDDLEQYKVLEHSCIHTTIENNTIFTAPGPFEGPRLLLAMHLLNLYNSSKSDKLGDLYQRFITSDLISYDKILEVVKSEKYDISNLTHTDLMNIINTTNLNQDVQKLVLDLPHFPDQATSEVTVIDTFDLYVSSVVGLGTQFGSRLMTKHGVLFNNLVPEEIAHLSKVAINDELLSVTADGTSFATTSRPPSTTNITTSMHPFMNRRPLNTYTPVIMTDQTDVCGRRAVLASGSSGAAMQVVAQMLYRDKSLADAIEEPRITNKPFSPIVYLDDTVSGLKRLPSNVKLLLNSKGFKFANLSPPIPSVNGVSKQKDTLSSQSDTRGGGIAARLDTLSS